MTNTLLFGLTYTHNYIGIFFYMSVLVAIVVKCFVWICWAILKMFYLYLSFKYLIDISFSAWPWSWHFNWTRFFFIIFIKYKSALLEPSLSLSWVSSSLVNKVKQFKYIIFKEIWNSLLDLALIIINNMQLYLFH